MSPRRIWEVFRIDFRHHLRRPLFWILVVVLVLLALLLSTGNARIVSGSSDVGGKKSWITSEFALSQILAMLTPMIFGFFVTIAAGMIVIRDEETKVGELLHSTPLKPGEYVWGKLLAAVSVFILALGIQVASHAFFNHALATARSAEFIGPFSIWSYAKPALVFGLPTILFFAGTGYALGELTRRPILIFALPVTALLVCGFFLWEFAPSWLDPRIDRLLMLVDPGGFRWLNRTWLVVDRGVDFYNHERVPLDAWILGNRAGFVALGLLAVVLAQWHFTSTLRGRRRVRLAPKLREAAASTVARPGGESVPIGALGMSSRRVTFLDGTLEVLRVELRELRASPGLYLFVPLILLQVIGNAAFAVGAFDTPLLWTSGTLAVGSMGTLTICVCLLLLFYVTESLVRESVRGLAPIHAATPVQTASVLLGKVLANGFVAVVILLAGLVGSAIVLLVQGRTGIEIRPFLLTWGVLLVPTFLLWSAFVAASYSITNNRFATYGIGLAAIVATVWFSNREWMSWAYNWSLWRTLQWSDLGTFELLRRELWLNRLLALSLAGTCLALAIRFFPRRGSDPAGVLMRLEPKRLFPSVFRLTPWLVVPLALWIWLLVDVREGFQSGAAKKHAKDYWAKNVQTWKDAPVPSVTAVDLDVELRPEDRWFKTKGTFTLCNEHEKPMPQIAVTRGFHWKNVEWSLEGEKVTPDDRAGLCVFTPAKPLAPNGSLMLGFLAEGRLPDGATRNGGGAGEFILPSGVVLTAFSPSFVPVMGFMNEIGIDHDNRTDARVYPEGFYEGVTKPIFGTGLPCTTKIRVRAPAEYTVNSVGTLTSEAVEDGIRTVVWESDHPMVFFNIVAGKWAVQRGDGVAVFHHPGHAYNVDEMVRTLEGARRWYSEWFHPFPWKELKLSEFPALAGYAQGFATNIPFSENIGFLTKSEAKADAVFLVTAHESAHQWWGNILVPGEGPGGNILSEGMSHFSSILLIDRMKGLHNRIELCKQLETRYGDNRQVDSEKPLVWIDGSRDGDTTVMYDKGGWVAWMLLNRMGREQALAGLRTFIRKYGNGPDHPVLQDFVATMRELALDKQAYDEFVKQWFFEVVVPEYRLADAVKTRIVGTDPGNGGGGDGDEWEVRVKVTNAGTGRMPIEIAAARGERFPEQTTEPVEDADPSTGSVEAAERVPEARETAGETAEEYREARTTITLGAGESQEAVLRCGFEPELVLVDPDALVLQLQRKLVVHRF